MKILHVCIGTPQRLEGRNYRTGILKAPVGSGVMVLDREGLVGDAVLNRRHHGGPDQAVYVLGAADLDWWSMELCRPVAPGTFGENLVVDGLDSRTVAIGDRFATEEVMLEATSVRMPCATLSARMGDPHFVRRFIEAGRPGFYCRVLRRGVVAAGDPITSDAFDGERILMPELLRAGRRLTEEERRRYLSTPLGDRLRRKIEMES
ncbi:MOSC domain-containing protein [Ensifer soli]|uniref:MOSC domain-containing protein n=1 Tax=Ciceribacter sp. sgz301302 TaxID=3342379 RepID=UPI0035B9A4FC